MKVITALVLIIAFVYLVVSGKKMIEREKEKTTLTLDLFDNKLVYAHDEEILADITQPIEVKLISGCNPIFNKSYAYSEHWDGQFKYQGDSLGSNCTIQYFVKTDDRLFSRTYRNE